MAWKRGGAVALGVAAIAVAAVIWHARGQRLDLLGGASALYSQGNEELVVRDFFQDRRRGVFVDVGCGLPQHNSMTFYLERHLGGQKIEMSEIQVPSITLMG